MKYGMQKSPATSTQPAAEARPAAKPLLAAEEPPTGEEPSAGEEPPVTKEQPVTQAPPAAPIRSATTMGCVYIGSKNYYFLKLRNWRNEAVLCIAKEKKFSGHRVVLVGVPRETSDYRCD